ncbi:hypothetical protein GF386_04210 [Candidatus Pacearchaeota archaeon]|nr:hypothetical protein [Candidatus Pacearchaeota archaeon]MBD3283324.1 hypothetical protein [Candidatus Pacearchaeota archaeon]
MKLLDDKKLLEKIKSSRKYKSLSEDLIKNEINDFLKKNQKTNQIKKEKQALKQIKAELHRIYASYQKKNKRKKQKYLNELTELIKQKNKISNQEFNIQLLEITNKLLSMNRSTKERLDNYPVFYKKLFQLTGKPKTILDLGSGLNPCSLPYILTNMKELNYYAYDIDKEDIDFLNDYFRIMKKSVNKKNSLKTKASILNLKNLDKVSNISSSDIIFMFKLTDLLGSKISEQLIKKLINKTRFIVVSFATKTLSGKLMNLPRRRGFELMLKRNNLKFQTIIIKNEIFYVIHE